ncbi:hypothetical protein [Promicromonospora soli]
MSTDTDPSALDDGAQAVRSLHALAESAQHLDPADSYYAIRDLLACVRHLSQVALHVATAHRNSADRAVAVNDFASGGLGLAGAVGDQLDGCRQHLDDARTTLQHAADRSIHIHWITPPRPAPAEPERSEPRPSLGYDRPRPVAAPPGSARRDAPWRGPQL